MTRMTDRTPGTNFMADLPEPLDIVAIERRARELRAQAFGDALRALVAFVLRRSTAARPAPQGRMA